MNQLKKIVIAFLFFVLVHTSYGQAPGYSDRSKDDKVPMAPKENRRPENFVPSVYKYSVEDLKDKFSSPVMKKSAAQYARVQSTNAKGRWKGTAESIDMHKVPEWFEDAKFGMFIDWGPWSVAGWAPKYEDGSAMYPDWYEFRFDEYDSFKGYHAKNWGNDFKRDDFIPLFRAEQYQPEKLVELAKESGMKYVVPFCKHHGGFCLWPSSFTQRDAMDMGPKRDLIKPIKKACDKEGLKFGFYFSIEEWEYPLLDSNGQLQNRLWKPYASNFDKKITGKIPVKDFGKDYLLPQATEFIDKYDPDLIWYDGDWDTSVDELKTYDIAAYLYNKADGRKEVAVNDRFGCTADNNWLRSRRGDFFTSEYGDMEKDVKQAAHAWEECRGISQSFGYNWQDTDENVISSKKFIDQFVNIVSHGGNLLLIINLDGQGALPKIQETRLRDIGAWLKVNGEGIYNTRAYSVKTEGKVCYTRSKDNKTVYAIAMEWPGSQLQLKSVKPQSGSKVYMLGYNQPLQWEVKDGVTTIVLPKELQKEINRPCKDAYTFRIEKE